MKVLLMPISDWTGEVVTFTQPLNYFRRLAGLLEQTGFEVDIVISPAQGAERPNERQLEDLLPALSEYGMVVIWNGLSPVQQKLAGLARESGAKVFYAELGWLPHYKTAQFGVRGVGAEHEMSHWNRQLEPVERRTYQQRRAAILDGIETGPPTGDYILVPCQLENDTQVVVHSSYGGRLKDFLVWAMDVIHQAGHRAVIKTRAGLHPAEQGHQGLIHSPDEMVSGELWPLLQGCRGVLTINSGVGIEALLLHRPVVTVGKAVYNAVVPLARDKVTALAELTALGNWSWPDVDDFLADILELQWSESDLDGNRYKLAEMVEKVLAGQELLVIPQGD